MEKQVLRQDLKASRMLLTAEEVQTKSARIVEQVMQCIDWNKISNVHCYNSIKEQNEPDTTRLLAHIQRLPNITTYTTRKIGDIWEHGRYKNDDFTEVNILPILDAIIVPCLGFDRQNNRLGYGAGFYDKFLVTQPQAQKIGLCFELGRVEHLPTETHDIPLDLILTEQPKQ